MHTICRAFATIILHAPKGDVVRKRLWREYLRITLKCELIPWCLFTPCPQPLDIPSVTVPSVRRHLVLLDSVIPNLIKLLYTVNLGFSSRRLLRSLLLLIRDLGRGFS